MVQWEQCHLWSAAIQHCCNCGLAQIGSVPLIPGPGTPYVIEGPKKKREKKPPKEGRGARRENLVFNT